MNVTVLLMVLLAIALFLLIWVSLKFLIDDKATDRFLVILNKSSISRKDKRENQRLEEGNFIDKSIIGKLDLLIERSAIRNHFEKFNSEVYIILSIILILIGFITGFKIFNFWLVGVAFSLVLIIIPYVILSLMSLYNYKKIDDCSLTFLNLMENYSASTSDVLTIVSKTAAYLPNPLKKMIEDFNNEAKSSGDITRAFRRLEYRIGNSKLRSIIRNIEICSRHEANYQEIINDSKRSFKDYLANEQKKNAIVNNGRKEIILCFIIGGVLTRMFSTFCPHLFTVLRSSVVGVGILFFCLLVIIYTFYNFLTLNKTRR